MLYWEGYGDFPGGQVVRTGAPTAGGMCSVPDGELRSHIPGDRGQKTKKWWWCGARPQKEKGNENEDFQTIHEYGHG